MRTRNAYWKTAAGAFPGLSLERFRQLGATDPEAAFRAWHDWAGDPGRHSDDVKFRKALELATALSPSAIGHYLSQFRDPLRNRAFHLSQATLSRLDSVSAALGLTPPQTGQTSPLPPSPRAGRRIALFADLVGVPSPRYHLEVVDSIIRAGERLNFSVALHAADRGEEEPRLIERVLRTNNPHAVVWFRITPGAAALAALASAGAPAVVIHGGRFRYPPPVIAHITPSHAGVSAAVELWARGVQHANRSRRRGRIVIAAMGDETYPAEFAPFDPNQPVCIRRERVEAVRQGALAAGFAAELAYVPDYTAPQAWPLLRDHPDASGYVCLSDELAVSVQQLLLAQGVNAERRILGFDGSDVARKHSIPSIDQHLTEIGDRTISLLAEALRGGTGAGGQWPASTEVPINLSLALWE